MFFAVCIPAFSQGGAQDPLWCSGGTASGAGHVGDAPGEITS